jgi:prepilin-type N-terminal cleavage/methylation domain-containing protein
MLGEKNDTNLQQGERMHRPGKKSGFTLVEISVSIVIMGLIAGAIMAAQGLIRRNEMIRITIDVGTYATAIGQFKQKYQQLPGDMSYASDVWGGLSSCPSGESTGKPTCNGNGNGIINSPEINPSSGVNDQVFCEHYRVWQHLSAAELIPGKYTGISELADCAPNSLPEKNSPSGSPKNTAFSITSYGYIDAEAAAKHNADFFEGDYNNVMMLGGVLKDNFAVAPTLTTTEAYEIDKKTDDESPATGKVRAPPESSTKIPDLNCVGGNNYNIKADGKECSLLFLNDFSQRKGDY